MPYIITIHESADTPQGTIEHYRRRVELQDLQRTISLIDTALNAPVPVPRKPRSDKGKPRENALL